MVDPKFTSAEQEKATILACAIEGKITNNHAAKQLGLSVRQVQRAKAAIRKKGIKSVIHGLKGKFSNHSISEDIKKRSLAVIKEQYPDFKPSFATEKLNENHDISISYGTTRLWMIEEKLWKPRKQKQNEYRSFRTRKEYFGELEQFDGCYHYWFEQRFVDENGNPIEVCLLTAIDDATGKITKAEFAAHEGVIPVFTFWKGYVTDIGKPLSIYLDRFSTYKINHKAAQDNTDLITQFARATRTLGIILIFANSPQAKGRIERLFKTLQDRLVKEMRLAKINNPTDGNKFLKEVFIPKYNAQFAVISAKEGNVHKALTDTERKQLDHIFSLHQTRRVNNDFTIQFKNRWYQLTEIQPITVRKQEVVLVEVFLDNSVHIVLKDNELAYMILSEKPKKQKVKQPLILTSHKLNYKPPPNHPWRLIINADIQKKLQGG
jgi:hypothetical protein